MKRTGLILMLILSAAFDFLPRANAQVSFAVTNRPPAPRRASVIFIQCDGLGYGDLSCYGQTKFQTPNMDKLAAEGVRLTNYFIGATGPQSEAALMLGKNPRSLKQITVTNAALAANETIVAQFLKNAGYRTGLIGQWNLGDENSSGAPWKKGFDEFAGYFTTNDAENFYADFVFRYDSTSGHLGREMLYLNTDGKKGEYIPDLLTKAAVNFTRNNQPDQFNHHRPFFLLLNYEIPDEKIAVPTDAPFSEEPWPQPEKKRAALISRIDDDIGQLQEQLLQQGMTNDVAIFISSVSRPVKTAETNPDFFHSNISSNDFRVPMIVHWPGKIPGGRVSGVKCSAADFLPTAMEIALRKPPANIDGVSLLPVLSGKKNQLPPGSAR